MHFKFCPFEKNLQPVILLGLCVRTKWDLNGISIYNICLLGLELYELMVIHLIHPREQKNIKHLESNLDIVMLTGR